MGYNTEYYGRVEIEPPLNEVERQYLKAFSESRRMQRVGGPYAVEPKDSHIWNNPNRAYPPEVIEYNYPPEGQPGLWCNWEPTEDGTALEWNGQEKFYDGPEWMEYLIEHFLKPDALSKFDEQFQAVSANKFEYNHKLNGILEAQGEEPGDHWFLVVHNNFVEVIETIQPTIETVNLRNILTCIGIWHVGHPTIAEGTELHEFLGMTWGQYTAYVEGRMSEKELAELGYYESEY